MPAQYVAMRDKFNQQGLSYDQAQAKAARIYNSRHPRSPVTRKDHVLKSKRKRQQESGH